MERKYGDVVWSRKGVFFILHMYDKYLGIDGAPSVIYVNVFFINSQNSLFREKILFFSTFASAGLDLILHFIICLGQWPCCCCRFYWVRREAFSHPVSPSIPSMDSGTSSRCIFFFRFSSTKTDLILFSLPHILVLSSPSHLQHGLSYRQI